MRDEFRYVWKKMSGDVSLAADVTFPNPMALTDRKVVLVIRQNLEDDSKEVMIAEHSTGMIHLAQRPDKGADLTDMTYTFGGSLARVRAGRIGIEKRGDSEAIFISIKGEGLHQFGPPAQVHFDEPFYVGIGFCSIFQHLLRSCAYAADEGTLPGRDAAIPGRGKEGSVGRHVRRRRHDWPTA